jgi:hypothetical protein
MHKNRVVAGVDIMKASVAMSRTLRVLCALGFLSASSSLVAARDGNPPADFGTPPSGEKAKPKSGKAGAAVNTSRSNITRPGLQKGATRATKDGKNEAREENYGYPKIK